MLGGTKDKCLTWEETYRAEAREKEDWSDLDATLADGIEPAEKWRRANAAGRTPGRLSRRHRPAS